MHLSHRWLQAAGSTAQVMLRSALLVATLALSVARARATEVLSDDDAPPTVLRTLGAPLRVGVFVGWHATSSDLDVLGDRVQGNEPSPGPSFGLRLGWRMTPGWGLDFSLGAVPAGSEWLVPLIGELRWRPLEGEASWTPTVALGAGVYAGFGAGGDVDALFTATTGLELVLAREVGVHLEGGVWASDGVSGPIAWTPVVTLGIELRAWRDRRERAEEEPLRPPPVVRGCPAGVPAERCADLDEDGVIDALDACPIEPGAVNGCPDDDGDGVASPRDACPLRRGAAADWGCPRAR
ncbi:MAG: hypothetical protein U1F43_30725 [Myxococcota bacterium]